MLKMRKIETFLGAVLVGLVLSALYVSSLIVEQQNLIRQTARYNVTWLASQSVVELQRFQERVASFSIPSSKVDADEVALRYQILLNRLSLLSSGEFEEFVNQGADRRATVDEFRQALAEIEPWVDHLNPENAARIRARLAPLDQKMSSLAAAANRISGDQVDGDQRELLSLHWFFSGIIVTLVLMSLGLVLLLHFRNRLLNHAHREMHVLTDGLKDAKGELERANEDISSKNDSLKNQNEMLVLRDIELRTQNQRFDAALNNMSQGLLLVDGEHRLIVCNERFRQMFELPASSTKPGASLTTVADERFAALLAHQKAIASGPRSATFSFELAAGTVCSVSQQPMPDGGWVATYEDVTERRRSEERIAYMAHHDALTDLPNRAQFREHLERALELHHGEAGSFAVLYLDLDRFKTVNDTLGHELGDALLKSVSVRLKKAVRGSDIVSRFGGDEFAVLCRGYPDLDELRRIASRIVERMGQPFRIAGRDIRIGTCVGIAMAIKDGSDCDSLLRHADMAMYAAKNTGRGTYCFYEAPMEEQIDARRALEDALRRALQENELEVYYQPIVNLKRMEIVSFEALLRWTHPVRGAISPAEFIPVAEETGLIVTIGEWVLRRACADAAQWPNGTRVSVNLSAVQLRNDDFAQIVFSALAGSQLPAHRLELEITESVLLQDSDATLAVLHQLRRFGIRTCMDDFGTGFSSLSYLRSFPFDKIKIDRSFVKDMHVQEDCRAIVTSIAHLGQSLNMTTTAEGVETREQLEAVMAVGCTEVQGYYFGPPTPAADVAQVFSRLEKMRLAA
ncbi:putative bifunctional diguanylate cyclase/phosphodiesterase [Bosea sp. 2YAB26]